MHSRKHRQLAPRRWIGWATCALSCLAACAAGHDTTTAAAPESPPAASTAPQLGKSPLPELIAALTREEKLLLVLGAGMDVPTLPPERQAPVGGRQPMRVPGAAGQTVPVPRLGIPAIVLADGPAGLRIDPKRDASPSESFFCTAFPIASALAASFNPLLVEDVGKAVGAEVRGYGVDVLLAPALNLHRVPLSGRNFEYYSEDPLLSGKAAAAMVRGVQSNGVGTTLKHFAANNQEWNRAVLNVRVDEQTLRELYLRGFELAVREGQPWAVMSSYNRINGTYTSEDPRLLTGILREQWGYGGLVMTDWFGGSDPVAQMKAGNDMLMPGTEHQRQQLGAALEGGALDETMLDRNVARVLELILKTPAFSGAPAPKVDLAAGARVSRAAGAESMVLLKNERAGLPLAQGARLALFGNGSYETYSGGTGSGNVNAAHVISLAQGLKAARFDLDAALEQRHQAHIANEKARQPAGEGFMGNPAFILRELVPEPALDAAEVERAAREAAAAVISVRRSSGEFADRDAYDFSLTATEKSLLAQVSRAFRAAAKPVVVVLNIGAPIDTASWRDQADAILLAWQPGQEAGHAIADVLGGVVNPSGKLPTTFPLAVDDAPATKNYPGSVLEPADGAQPNRDAKAAEVQYAERLSVGYRHYQTAGARVAYPFGHGLSYTTFGYGPLERQGGSSPDRWTFSIRIENTGKVAGAEAVQLYVSAPASQRARPALELRAFAKTRRLEPGEAQLLSFELGPRELAAFDAQADAWVAAAGKYTLRAGASVADIRRTAELELKASLHVALR